MSPRERRARSVESAVTLRVDERLESSRRQYGRSRRLAAGCGVIEHHALGRHHGKRALTRDLAIALQDTIPGRVAPQLFEILEAIEPEFLDAGMLADAAGFEQGALEYARIEPETRILHISSQNAE